MHSEGCRLRLSMYIRMYVLSNLPLHTLESQKRGTYQWIHHNTGTIKKSDLAKYASFKSYGVNFLTATVPDHDAAFLNLLFQQPRFLKLFKRLMVGSALPAIQVYSMYIHGAAGHSSNCKAI